jgi:hypothetical protein
MTRRALAWLGVMLFVPCAALAQGAPRGPADVIGGARKARDERDLEQAAQRGVEGTVPPPVPPAAAPDPADAAASGHPGLDDPSAREPVASQHEDTSLPDGTLRVRVLDASGAPAADATVSIGIMSADSKRSSLDGRTGSDGYATFSNLAMGERQAYRVNVPYQGAKYSSTPFRLPPRGGYEVQIRRLPVTRDERMVVLYLGATSIELKDERLKIVQQVELLNLGGATYVFPEAGTLVRFPKGFLAVQTQDSMTDQHVSEAPGEGVRVKGSLPPGQVTLLWGFDLPLSGSEASFTVEIPWLTFAYRVIADAPPGMTLEVEGMPEPIVHSDSGRHFLVTELQRKVGDTPFPRVHVTLRGMPGPGPGRWIAALLALAVIAAGVRGLRARRDQPTAVAGDAIEALKTEVLGRARELAEQRESGEIGPDYHAEQLRELETELAALLFEQAQQKPGRKRAPAAS